MNRRISAFLTPLFLFVCLLTPTAFAKGSGGSLGGSHSASSNHSRKTEHVSSYTRKNGTKVKEYKRRPATR